MSHQYIGRSPALSKNQPPGGGLGFGQKYVNFTNAQRAFGVYYVNDTGRAIWVAATASSNNGVTYYNMTAYTNPDGNPANNIIASYKGVWSPSNGYYANCGFIVPAGHSYYIGSSNGIFFNWVELR